MRKTAGLLVATAAGCGLLAAVPAAAFASTGAAQVAQVAPGAQVTPALGGCAAGDLEVDYVSGPPLCDPSHSSHTDQINRCDVLDIYSGANTVAATVGPNYDYVGPNTLITVGGNCVGEIVVIP